MLDLTFRTKAGHGTRCCRLRVFYLKRQVGQTTVIFRTAVATHPPPDILPVINRLCHDYHIDPDRLIWINHIPVHRRFLFFRVPEGFTRLHLEWDGTAFVQVSAEPLTPTAAYALIGTAL